MAAGSPTLSIYPFTVLTSSVINSSHLFSVAVSCLWASALRITIFIVAVIVPSLVFHDFGCRILGLLQFDYSFVITVVAINESHFSCFLRTTNMLLPLARGTLTPFDG